MHGLERLRERVHAVLIPSSAMPGADVELRVTGLRYWGEVGNVCTDILPALSVRESCFTPQTTVP